MSDKPMPLKKAVALACAALRSENQKLAFQANIFDRFGDALPSAVNASRIRKENKRAIETLRSLLF